MTPPVTMGECCNARGRDAGGGGMQDSTGPAAVEHGHGRVGLTIRPIIRRQARCPDKGLAPWVDVAPG